MTFLKKNMGNVYTPLTAHSHPTTPKYPTFENVKNNLYIRLATNYAIEEKRISL